MAGVPRTIKGLITGADGQLGRSLREFDPGAIYMSRKELDIADPRQVRTVIKEHDPAYLVNCAAYTAVDKAETEKEDAFRINASAVGTLAAACKENNTHFFHISTDYVFDGEASVPYTEDSPVNPRSVYGASKLEGERLALDHNPSSIIIRTSWVYSEHGKNFVKTMLRLMSEKEQINVVNDQFGSPTYAADLAETVNKICCSGKRQPGIYHYSNKGVISWYDLAVKIRDLAGFSCVINPIPTSEYPTPARRPAYSVLDNSKIKEVYHVAQRDWEDSLKICLQRLNALKEQRWTN